MSQKPTPEALAATEQDAKKYFQQFPTFTALLAHAFKDARCQDPLGKYTSLIPLNLKLSGFFVTTDHGGCITEGHYQGPLNPAHVVYVSGYTIALKNYPHLSRQGWLAFEATIKTLFEQHYPNHSWPAFKEGTEQYYTKLERYWRRKEQKLLAEIQAANQGF